MEDYQLLIGLQRLSRHLRPEIDSQHASRELHASINRFIVTWMQTDTPPLQELLRKFAAELEEKNFEPGLIARAAGGLEKVVSARRTKKEITFSVRNNCVVYQEFKKYIKPSHYHKLLELYKKNNKFSENAFTQAMSRLLLRHSLLTYGDVGQHYAIPQSYYDRLYNEFNVRNEGFASPLTTMLGEKHGAHYCSLSPETDAVFGSSGSFFQINLGQYPGNWCINPPFIEAVLADAARQVVNYCTDSPKDKLIFFVGPNWTDAEFYRILETSACLNRHIVAHRKQHYYYNFETEEPFVANFESVLFVLGDKKIRLPDDVCYPWFKKID